MFVTDRRQVGKTEYFSVEIDGIKISDCRLINGSKGAFVVGPSKSFVAKDGTTKYVDLVKFDNDIQRGIKRLLSGDTTTQSTTQSVDNVPITSPDYDDDIPF